MDIPLHKSQSLQLQFEGFLEKVNFIHVIKHNRCDNQAPCILLPTGFKENVSHVTVCVLLPFCNFGWQVEMQ